MDYSLLSLELLPVIHHICLHLILYKSIKLFLVSKVSLIFKFYFHTNYQIKIKAAALAAQPKSLLLAGRYK